jgi:NADH:ubiquinone oxidoreductase subunit E
MPEPKIHEVIDILIFGKSYPEVHKWIDGAFNGTNGRTHWKYNHHLAAIQEKYPLLPEDREENIAARVHVMVDWLWYYRTFYMPIDSEAVKTKLREFGVVI